jgi:predicted methyltransferase
VAFICDVYHHFEFPAQTLESIHSALSEGGRLIVIDFERIPGVSREWTLGHVRAGKETFIEEIEAAGFQLVAEREIQGFEENYYVEFRKR